MVNVLTCEVGGVGNALFPVFRAESRGGRGKAAPGLSMLLAALILVCPIAFAQGSPEVTTVDPPSGKVNDTVTISGSNLDKSTVSAVYLSDDKDDFKATVTDQSADKIVFKVPQVKAGDYNVTVQVGNKLFIKPVRFKVEE